MVVVGILGFPLLDHSQAVMKAMADFKLPDSVEPSWAKVVPEEVWKKELIEQLRQKRT